MKRFAVIGTGLVIVALLVIFLLPRREHPKFGNIERAMMIVSYPATPIERVVSDLKTVLRKSDYLNIGDARMLWSLRGSHPKTGWLYFLDPGSNEPVWEFAPCSRKTLGELVVGDTDAEFIQNGDTNKIASSFDAAEDGPPVSGRASL